MSAHRVTLRGMVEIGAHLHEGDPLTEARARQADLVQIFLGDPQGFKAPPDRSAEAAALAEAGIGYYVHAPYLVNVATLNNRIRIPSRKLLDQQAAAAAAIGARGLIVHGGHVNAGDDPEQGYANWHKVFSRAQESGGFPLPIIIENTAGGENAMARRLDRVGRLWDAIGEFDPRFCLDTCHAHAAGEELLDVVDRVKALIGRIDLVHANGSRDPFGSGADRHTNFDTGEIDPDAIVAVCLAAGTPVIVETPGGAEGQGADIAFLRSRLPH
jgi:deoxyribonuclease IV